MGNKQVGTPRDGQNTPRAENVSSYSGTNANQKHSAHSMIDANPSLSEDNAVPPTVAVESGGCSRINSLSISQYQKTLIRDAWHRIGKKGAGSIGSQIFRRMFEKESDIKKVFQHVTVIEGCFSGGPTSTQAYQHHSELFIEVLDESILNLDDLNAIIPKLNEYGAKHAPFKAYGFKAEYWDIFGEAMISAAREWEGWRKHRETLRAWTLLISFIVDRMRQGYETAVRRAGMNRQPSIQPPNQYRQQKNDSQESIERNDINGGGESHRNTEGECFGDGRGTSGKFIDDSFDEDNRQQQHQHQQQNRKSMDRSSVDKDADAADRLSRRGEDNHQTSNSNN